MGWSGRDVVLKFSFSISFLAGSKRKHTEAIKEEGEDEMSAEEKKLALMMLPKKKKALYDKIMHSKKKKASQVSSKTPFILCFAAKAGRSFS